MTAKAYRFLNFSLDAEARELHCNGALVPLSVSTLDCLIYLIRNRHRTVGRDELTAAVWGKVEMSDVSLSHAIMKLRRLLGDSGIQQNGIRTLPRLGYRWIVEPTHEDAAISDPVSPDDARKFDIPPAQLPSQVLTNTNHDQPAARPASKKVVVLCLSACVVLMTVLGSLLSHYRARNEPASERKGEMTALVLPARIDASDEWSWLHYGFMDLISNHLRRGGVITTPSETVVRLDNANMLDPLEVTSGMMLHRNAGMTIQPHAAFVNGLWDVHVNAAFSGRELIAAAQAKDIVTAGRAATDELLIKLGRTPPVTDETDPSVAAEELVQHVFTASLTGKLDVASALIRNAPDFVKESPELKLSRAIVEMFAGNYEESLSDAQRLLDVLPEDRNLRLRARAYSLVGSANVRLNRNADADKAFVQAIRLLTSQNEPDRLATAYTGRGVVAAEAKRLDDSAAYFGRARTLHELANDDFGVARADLNLGVITKERGLPYEAMPILEAAASRFESLAAPEPLNAALLALADTQASIVLNKEALESTDRFWPPEAHSHNPREMWILTVARARALAANGRLREATELITKIRESSDEKKDVVVRLQAESVAAQLALLQGDNAGAAARAEAAMAPLLRSTNWHDYANTWFVRIRALQRNKSAEVSAQQISAFSDWVKNAPYDTHEVLVALARADQMSLENGPAASIESYAAAMKSAELSGIPEIILTVAEPFVIALLKTNLVDRAAAIAGQVAKWNEKDMRAAWIQSAVYESMGKPDAARIALQKARALATERQLIDLPSVPAQPR